MMASARLESLRVLVFLKRTALAELLGPAHPTIRCANPCVGRFSCGALDEASNAGDVEALQRGDQLLPSRCFSFPLIKALVDGVLRLGQASE
jgi:hypothetical protein